jgi:soluble lytic murein transglycosylase-like protein
MVVRSATTGCLVLLLGVAAPVCADIYSFTDEQGVTHLSNVPADTRYQVLVHSAPAVSEAGGRISDAQLARSAQYDAIIESASANTAVEADLLRAVIVVESGFDANAVSPKGAQGLMQLMPSTAKAYGAADASNPSQNIHAGARYLRRLLDRYDNDLELVLAAYNSGEAAVERHNNSIPPFRETRQYIPKVLRIYRELQRVAATT